MTTIINAVSGTGLTQTSDGSGVLVLQGAGVTGLTVDSTGAYGQLKSGTPQNTTSGTAIDFTGIPSWVKRITVMLNGVSTNGTSLPILRIGSGSIQTAGYDSTASISGATGGYTSSTAGYLVNYANSAAAIHTGLITLTNISGNMWVAGGTVNNNNTCCATSGVATLSGTLDRIRLTTVSGTDTFDAGSVNILYEG